MIFFILRLPAFSPKKYSEFVFMPLTSTSKIHVPASRPVNFDSTKVAAASVSSALFLEMLKLERSWIAIAFSISDDRHSLAVAKSLLIPATRHESTEPEIEAVDEMVENISSPF